jgi:threonine/homoserine/homoserine lactone efflux protein
MRRLFAGALLASWVLHALPLTLNVVLTLLFIAVAIPLGAIGVLIVDLGVRGGFRPAFLAGLGTALADGLYATLGVRWSFGGYTQAGRTY